MADIGNRPLLSGGRSRHPWPASQLFLLRPCWAELQMRHLSRKQVGRSTVGRGVRTLARPSHVAAAAAEPPAWPRNRTAPRRLGPPPVGIGNPRRPRPQKGKHGSVPDRRARWMAASRSSPLPRKAAASFPRRSVASAAHSAERPQTPKSVDRCPPVAYGFLDLGLGLGLGLCHQTEPPAKHAAGLGPSPGRSRWPRPDDAEAAQATKKCGGSGTATEERHQLGRAPCGELMMFNVNPWRHLCKVEPGESAANTVPGPGLLYWPEP